MKKLLFLLLVFSNSLEAQTVRADRFTFNTGACTMRSGSGAPSAGLGIVCDTYIDTTTGVLWLKQSGGWVVSGVSGTGTTGNLAKWLSAISIGNSSIDEYSSPVILRMQPAGDIELNPTGNDVLPTSNYDINFGSLTNKFLTGHFAEIWSETLVAQNTIATIGGRILVGPTSPLVQDFAPAGTTIVLKHNSFATGDRIYLESDSKVEFMAITAGPAAGSGGFEYAVTRNLDGSGANQWYAGDAAFNTGQAGNGFWDIYSVRGVKAGTEIGPTIVANQRLSSTYNDWAPRAAIGNLNGLYGYSGSVYGAVFGVPSSSRVTIDGTSGVQIYGSDNDPKVTIDMAGNATFDGNLTVGTGRNQIRNSECRVGTEEWSFSNPNSLSNVGLFGPSFSPWRLLDESNTCYLEALGTPPNNNSTLANLSTKMVATAGLRYEFSAYLGNANNQYGRVLVTWFQADGTQISQTFGNQCTPAQGTGGVNISSWCRSGTIATAPALTAYAGFSVQSVYDGVGTNAYTFFVRAYFGEAGAAQEELTQWGPAGITEIIGGLIKTDAIDARTIAADSITASELAANSITAVDIQAGTITADKLNVSTLSAITADLGTVTAGSITGGTIDGATIRAGTGDEITLDSSGITIAAGSGTNNRIKWSGVGDLWGVSGFIHASTALSSTGSIQSTGGAGTHVQGYDIIPINSFKQSSMPSSTGTAVIYEASCECLKKDSSSERYKENIQRWKVPNAQQLLGLTPIRFDYRGGEKNVVGLSAEEVFKVAPEVVNLDVNGNPDSIRQGAMNVYLLQIIKELRNEINALKAERLK